MAVAPASLADKIIVLDDEEDDDENKEENPQTSCVTPTPSSEQKDKNVSPLRAQHPPPTHITRSPFASSKKDKHVLEAENHRLFTEFVEHCTPFTKDCPEVLTFLQTKHAKASPDYLSSVEFRNTLGRCLTRVQANRSKTFVYINELCTVLRQHAAKKRKILTKVESSTSSSNTSQSTSVMSQSKGKADEDNDEEEEVKLTADDEQPSTSGLQADNNGEAQGAERTVKRASRKQIAYLENLLKMYNDEICRLQKAELSVDDLGAEDSLYIQEHKLKRKIMKIYEKLCELKGCSTLTGRVIEHKIPYSGTRYPEINKRIERFINSPEARRNPPDYQDILQQVLRANERHNLGLSRKHLNQMAQEAFRETGTLMQERRHMDLVYNFGSHLTDAYKPATDPALSDPALLRKLRSNREEALSRLEDVITRYAIRQEDTEEVDRQKRLDKGSKEKEGNKPGKGKETKEVNGAAEEEKEEEGEDDDDDDDEEDDESSDPDIEEEIKASTQQDGPDDDDGDEEDNTNEAEQAEDAANDEDQAVGLMGSVFAGEGGSNKDEEEEPVTSGLHLSNGASQISPMPDTPSSRDSPSQTEPAQHDYQRPMSNGDVAGSEESVDSSSRISDPLENTGEVTKGPADVTTAAANNVSLHLSIADDAPDHVTNGTSPPPSPRATRSQKRKREEKTPPRKLRHTIISDGSEVDIPLDMGVFSCSSPLHAESTRADTPSQEIVSSSQSTPPPKKNKVNVATQCDPDEIIVLDSD